jgi:riboflavin biosynthesis pyrimidine reductase
MDFKVYGSGEEEENMFQSFLKILRELSISEVMLEGGGEGTKHDKLSICIYRTVQIS